MAAPLTFDGFDRPAMAEAEGGIDDTEAMEAKPAQKTTNNFLHLTIATGHFTDPTRTFVGPKRQNLSLFGSPRLLILVRLKSFSRKLRQARRTG